MTKITIYAAAALNLALLALSYVVFDEVRWYGSWGRYWDKNLYLILAVAAPLTTLLLIFFAIRENAMEYVRVTLLRRRLEGERKVLEEHQKINELLSKK